MSERSIAILGAGSWGTAIAIHLARNGNEVYLWGRDAAHIKALQTHKENQRYLPGIPLPDNLIPTSDLNLCQSMAKDLMIAVPSHAFESLLVQLTPPTSGLSWLTKGINPGNPQLLSCRDVRPLVCDRSGQRIPNSTDPRQ